MQVKIKWNKLNYDLEVDPSSGVLAFKRIIQEATGVPPDRQKLMGGKGLWSGILKDDADLTTVSFAPGSVVTLMGTADVVKAPAAAVLFVEDMSDAEKAEKGAVAAPAGLRNLGNTCYMNSVLECVRYMPDLREALPVAQSRDGPDDRIVLSSDLRETLNHLDRSVGSVIPAFVPQIRAKRALFAEMVNHGDHSHYVQQDAEEFFSEIVNIIGAGVQVRGRRMSDFLEMELESVLTCQESSDEPLRIRREPASKLVCNIQGSVGSTTTVNHLHEGLALSLNSSVSELESQILGRNAVWSKKVKVAKLSKYLCIQFMRFFWKETPDSRDHQGVKCKIIRAVRFEDKFDIYDCCTEKVKAVLRTNRLADEKLENELLEKKRAKMSADVSSVPPIPAVGGGATASATDMEVVDEEDAAALAAALAMSVGENTSPPSPECFNSGVPKNFTGVYELFGVVTHKGRDADHGHYIGWVRQAEGSPLWWKFDDEVVTEVRTENILDLKGGGDRDIAYLNFYRALERKHD